MKKIYYNAKVYLEREKFAEGFVVEADRFVKVGSNEEVLSLAAEGDEKIDCKGKTIIPGFNDSHLHLLGMGEYLCKPDLGAARSIDEMVEMCKKYIDDHPEETKGGLHACGWNQDLFVDEQRIPDRRDLDRISTEIPVFLERICGHICSGNTKLIELMGLDENSPQFDGGEFLVGEDGYPNGVFTENACNIAKNYFPPDDLETIIRYLDTATDRAVSFGITSVQSNDIGTIAMDWKRYFKIFRDYYASGRGKVRYRHQSCFLTLEDLEEYIETEYARKDELYPEGSLITLGPLKIFKDGSLGARTAILRGPYYDAPDAKGTSWADRETIQKFCDRATEAGMQVVVHAIGDGAIEEMIDAYSNTDTDGDSVKNPLRHQLIHCQITDRNLLERIAENKILVSYQPCFLDYDMKIADRLCGAELASTSYAFNTMDELIPGYVSYGTDAPVEDFDPFANIYYAVTRKNSDGTQVFYPQECVDIYTAIDAYTKNSAFAEFCENSKGRVREGYLADFAVLDTDIFMVAPEDIRNTRVTETVVGGKTVYSII
ncbi:MAG: amidohydrolase [Firmicutes bacterium]|nr:amidohydrolase [Bacillota bacterium]